ncbi:MAG TPA: hypothetical protein VIA62_01400 [Thermoanaerobaculia bacterium]|jgi:hypothetical protein|nr:hypothetical protein [Thermoanaerobaculia bacterium]
MDEAALRPYREYHARRERARREGRELEMLSRVKFLILEREIQSDIQRVEEIYTALGSPELGEAGSQQTLIVQAYRLYSLYIIFENIFRNIATAFENHLDPSGWHRQLLQRMQRDLAPLRPAVIDSEAYERLDEMLRFRHVFRTMYGLRLDPFRLQGVLRNALELKELYRPQFERFLEFLRGLE